MKKPYTNQTKKFQHIGSVTVMPGQTRMVDEIDLVAFTDAEPETTTESPTNAQGEFDELLAKPVADVVKALPGMSAAELDAIEAAENATDKPRKGVLSGIAEARLSLASQNQNDGGTDTELQSFIDGLADIDDDLLAEYRDLYQDDDEATAYLQAVEAEMEKRAANSDD